MDSYIKLIESKAQEFFDLKEDNLIVWDKYTDHKILNARQRESELKHHHIIEAYKDIIKETSNFINRTITTDNILTINGAITFLIWRGYTSYNQKFSFANGDFLNMFNYNGINVVLGQGVCRHIACFANDILKQFDISSQLIGNMLNQDIIEKKDKFKLPITRTYNGDSFKGIENHTSVSLDPYDTCYLCNHLCFILPYQDTQLMYDPTNLLLFSINGTKANFLFGKGYAIISPYDLIYRSGMTKKEVEEYIQNITLSKHLKRKDIKEMYQSLLLGINMLKNNPFECNQLYEKIKEPAEYIYEYQYQLKK